MKIVVIYRANSSHARVVEEFLDAFKRRDSDTELVVLDIDSVEGTNMASLYGIVSYPAILAIQADGSLSKLWEGDTLPLLNEVESYFVA